MSHFNTAYSMPLAVQKGAAYPAYPAYSSSPNECDDAMSQASAVPSGYSATSAGYMGAATGSGSDYDAHAASSSSASANSAAGVDFQDYMQDRFSNSFNPIPLDRSMAVQAQT